MQFEYYITLHNNPTIIESVHSRQYGTFDEIKYENLEYFLNSWLSTGVYRFEPWNLLPNDTKSNKSKIKRWMNHG